MTLALLETLEPLRVQRFEQVDDRFSTPNTAHAKAPLPRVVDLEAGRLVSVTEGRDE
jgi:hypothetical protein